SRRVVGRFFRVCWRIRFRAGNPVRLGRGARAKSCCFKAIAGPRRRMTFNRLTWGLLIDGVRGIFRFLKHLPVASNAGASAPGCDWLSDASG
ncbi:MAG: hypothetical protein RMJ55_07090, partial [Roseiflexaceae bacterium]|nr:hypothetical protein [Roseiflexaceae bacterium]